VRRPRPRRPHRDRAVPERPEPSRLGHRPALRGSNFYWYLRDPSGAFLELYSDLDRITDDAAWEQRGRTPLSLEAHVNTWGPNLPPEFVVPHDLAELESGWATLDSASERPDVTDLFTNAHRFGDLDAWRREGRPAPCPGPDPPDRANRLQPFWR